MALPASITRKNLEQLLITKPNQHGQRLYPVVDDQGQLLGVATRNDLQHLTQTMQENDPLLASCIQSNPVVAYPDESLRPVVYRMAQTGFTRFPVVERNNPKQLVGIVGLTDLLKARSRNLTEERRRERVLRMRVLFPERTRVPR